MYGLSALTSRCPNRTKSHNRTPSRPVSPCRAPSGGFSSYHDPGKSSRRLRTRTAPRSSGGARETSGCPCGRTISRTCHICAAFHCFHRAIVALRRCVAFLFQRPPGEGRGRPRNVSADLPVVFVVRFRSRLRKRPVRPKVTRRERLGIFFVLSITGGNIFADAGTGVWFVCNVGHFCLNVMEHQYATAMF